jgi:hypothetical protein
LWWLASAFSIVLVVVLVLVLDSSELLKRGVEDDDESLARGFPRARAR